MEEGYIGNPTFRFWDPAEAWCRRRDGPPDPAGATSEITTLSAGTFAACPLITPHLSENFCKLSEPACSTS